MTPSPHDLARLLHKYETLADLRHARARGEPVPPQSVFKTLAAEFPGALYELDRLPLEDIESRKQALSQALQGGPTPLWMCALPAYHALYRAALYLKPRVRTSGPLTPEHLQTLAHKATGHASIDVPPAFVQAIANPPGGRLGPLILAEVAARLAEAPTAVLQAMFPPRRDCPPTTPS